MMRNQRSNCQHSLDHRESEFQKNIYLCFISYAKAFGSVAHNKLWKALKEMGIPDYLTWLLRNLYAGQEAIVRILCGTTNNLGSRLRKEYDRAVCCHPVCLTYMLSIMRNAKLDELQARIKRGRETSTTSATWMIPL